MLQDVAAEVVAAPMLQHAAAWPIVLLSLGAGDRNLQIAAKPSIIEMRGREAEIRETEVGWQMARRTCTAERSTFLNRGTK